MKWKKKQKQKQKLNYLSIGANLLFPVEEGDPESDESIAAYQEEET